MNLEELLADAKTYSDEVVVEIPGEKPVKFKLGDVRSFRGKAAADEKKLADALKQAATERENLTTLGAQAATLLEKLKLEESKQPPPKVDEPSFEDDPIFGPLVVKRLKPLEELVKTVQSSLEKKVDAINTAIADSAKFLLHDYYERQWNQVPEARRPKDKTWKDFIKIAAEKKIVNEFNLPDPVAALMREVEPVEKSDMQKRLDALEKENADLKKQASAPRMPRPGATGIPATAVSDKGKSFGSVDEMVDAAFSDPDILAIAGGGRPA